MDTYHLAYTSLDAKSVGDLWNLATVGPCDVDGRIRDEVVVICIAQQRHLVHKPPECSMSAIHDHRRCMKSFLLGLVVLHQNTIMALGTVGATQGRIIIVIPPPFGKVSRFLFIVHLVRPWPGGLGMPWKKGASVHVQAASATETKTSCASMVTDGLLG